MAYFLRPLLPGKLKIPVVEAPCLLRGRLLARLNKEVELATVVLQASTGYGKTTLLSQWAEQAYLPVAWVTLDEYDNDPGMFLAYIVGAFQTLIPGACPEMRELLGVTPLPPSVVLWDTLIHELALLGEIGLVLDDYHLIQNEELHSGMARLIQHKPIHMQLLIASRNETRGWVSHQLRQKIVLLNALDLGFKLEEARAFLAQSLGTLNLGDVERLVEQTEGWAMSLRLVARATAQGEDFSRWVALFQKDAPRVLIEYLRREVFMPLPAVLQEFLLKTSLLDRFCVSLCEALDETWAVRTLLEQVQAGGLFLLQLDAHGEWFRYHTVFREFLQREVFKCCSPGELGEIHHRASAWWGAKGYLLEACVHALAAEDFDGAARYVMENLHEVLNRQEYPVLAQWLQRFPPKVIHEHPALLIAQGYLLYHQNFLGAIPAILNRAQTLLNEQPPSLSSAEVEEMYGDVDVLLAQVAYWNLALSEARLAGERALTRQPETHLYARGAVLAMILASYAVQGETQKALELARVEIAHTDPNKTPLLSQLFYTAGIIQMLAGNYQAVLERRDRFFQATSDYSGALFLGRTYYALGMVCYERNELEAALAYWAKLIPLKYRTSHYVYFQGVMGMALANQALGLKNDAEFFAEMARKFAEEMQQEEMYLDARTFRVHLAILQGSEPRDADDRAFWQGINPAPYDFFKISIQTAVITRIWFLICRNTPQSLREANTLVNTSFKITESFYNIPLMIKLYALRALILEAQKQPVEAEDTLIQAIELAHPRRFVRSFVDLGASMRELLVRLANKGFARKYLLYIIDAFPDFIVAPAHPQDIRKAVKQSTLTARELEVLSLLSKRYSDKEIASHLVISSQTVRRHTANIYSKLGVKNRREAVLLAHKRGILHR